MILFCERDYGYSEFRILASPHRKSTIFIRLSHLSLTTTKEIRAQIIRMFRENAHRLSICFHGNDHTEAELASTRHRPSQQTAWVAEERMKVHEQATGLHCDKVMVFPQDDYSVEAMEVLKSRNFHAASSSPYPVGQHVPLRIADLAQPAVLRYGGIPLFMRSFIRHTRSQDIAFNLFFGRPILIGEHHDTFKHPGSLLEVVQNDQLALRPEYLGPISRASWTIHFSSGERQMERCRFGLIRVTCSLRTIPLPWSGFPLNGASLVSSPSLNRCFGTGFASRMLNSMKSGIRVQAELPPGASQIFSVVYRNALAAPLETLALCGTCKVFLRRRLSELRDNYLSKNQHVLTAAKALQRRFLSGSP